MVACASMFDRHVDEDLEDGEIIEEDFDEEPSQKSEPEPVNKAPEKEQRREPKAINNFDDNFPSPPKRPKNNFKKTYDSWNDRPFKDKSKKPFDSAKEDEFRFKKKRKKPRKEDEPSKPAKKPRTEKGQGNSESGELDDDEDFLFVRGASPSGEFKRLSTNTASSNNNYEENESGDEEDFPEPGGNRGRGRGSFSGRHMRGSDRRSRPPMRGMRGKRGRGGILRKGKFKDENQEDSICKFFMQGKCLWGDDCPYSHDACPPKKMELCKFYLMDCCAKRDKCLYMHNDFPCKYYHTNLRCFAGRNCKFSHGKLNDQLRTILIKHIETAPKEILGEFPRIGRDGAIAFLKSGGVRNPALDGPDDHRSSPDEQMNHTPVPSPPSSNPQDSDMPNFSNENFDDKYGSSNFNDDRFSSRSKSKNKKDKKWKNGKREERHHRKEERRSEKERHRSEKSKEKDRDGDRDRDERRSSKHGPRDDGEFHQFNFYENAYGYNPNFSNEQYNQQFSEHTQGNPYAGSNQQPPSMGSPSKFTPAPNQTQCNEQIPLPPEEPPPPKSEVKAEIKRESKEETEEKKTEERKADETKESKEAKETKEAKDIKEEEDKLRERDEILNNMPKKQRELFLRIQQHQRDSVMKEEEPEPEPEPKEEENWYSSDEEDENKEQTPLSAILRTLQFQSSATSSQGSNPPNASPKQETSRNAEPENQPPPLLIPHQFQNINISDEVSKLLSTIRSQTEQQKEEPSKEPPPPKSQPKPQVPALTQPKMNPVMQPHFPIQPPAPKVRDPRLARNESGFVPTPQPAVKKDVHTPINIPLKRQSTEAENSGLSLMDIDLRLPNPELKESAASISGDVDLRHLPFKPAPVHQAATEIDASISSHPPIPYRLIPINVPKIDYSNILSSSKGALQDPRLRPERLTVQPSSSKETSTPTSPPPHPPTQQHASQGMHPQYAPNAPTGGVRDPRKAGGPADPRLSDGPSRVDPRMDPRQRPGVGGVPDPRVRMQTSNAPPIMPGTPMYDEDSRNKFGPNFNPMMPNPFSMDSDLRQMMNPMHCPPGMRPPFDPEFPSAHDPRMRADPRKAKEDSRNQGYGFSPNQPFDGDIDLRMNQMPRYNYSK
ncbi:uncharacterized protein su(sable) isoform X3 [Bemisia tabaci]|uniref:uncharacterized protein su(sable) isoform X3 n=1 Tax=Bemisia tabaci TaxID=7038 RepID=UPI003B288316